MSSVVRQIEAALEIQILLFRILKFGLPRAHQTVELLLRRRFSLELANANQIVELLNTHPLSLSALCIPRPIPV